jgi:co-chaperonin GroES (HSP10)
MSEFFYAAPAARRVFVSFEEPEETAGEAGLIIRPTMSRRVKDEAVVIAVGPGAYDSNGNWIEAPCKVGDIVWLNPNGVNEEKKYTDEDGEVRTIAVFTFSQISGVILAPEASVHG